MSAIPDLSRFRRIVIKVGSSLLVDSARGAVKLAWLASLAEDVFALRQRGVDVMVVSSGAIALGRTILKLQSGDLKLDESQAAAAVGQIALGRVWSEVLAAYQIQAGQILVTLDDTEERRRYLNARSTIARLLDLKVVPVINENDTVATTEIRYGDNDRLAARVAAMCSADCLILLSDVDGLYSAPPHLDPDARFVPVVQAITPEIEAMAGLAASSYSRGGMKTKIMAAKIATTAGVHMVIANGQIKNPVQAIVSGGRCSWFLTPETPLTARKAWIASSLESRGDLHIDAGAVEALHRGKSLLPKGVLRCAGKFFRGDAVRIVGPDGAEVARGLVSYDAPDALLLCGHSSNEIEQILGYSGRHEMVHRDDMVLSHGG